MQYQPKQHVSRRIHLWTYFQTPRSSFCLQIPPVFPLTFFHPSCTLPSTQALHAPHSMSLTLSAEVMHGKSGRAEEVPVPCNMK